ncbi:DNA (cytosine-5)-methyltransferase 3A-like isoform X2 [Palaemon carinicauda]|uniref:DNA (cytosine-5)-methyltransferase 3A-like isoform X2 n=1 Tax=Palaemon carinicauda TaxID=392227 RepID=UPI0035B5B61B
MMESNYEVLVLSDSDCESDWEGNIPKIVSTKSLSFNMPKIESAKSLSSSGSESGFSGFRIRAEGRASRMLYDDLEIVEEVIWDGRPGNVRRRLPLGQTVPYRERKLGFQWVKVKKENTSPTSQLSEENSPPTSQLSEENSPPKSQLSEENSLPTSQLSEENSLPTSQLSEENSLPTSQLSEESSLPTSQLSEENSPSILGKSQICIDTSNVNGTYTTPKLKRRSFAAMRPSIPSSDQKCEKRLRSSQAEEEPPSSPIDTDVTTLDDSDDAEENTDENEQATKENKGNSPEKSPQEKEDSNKDQSLESSDMDSSENPKKRKFKVLKRRSRLDESPNDKKDSDKGHSQENSDAESNGKRLKRKLLRFSLCTTNLESDSSSGGSTPTRSDECGEEAAKDNECGEEAAKDNNNLPDEPSKDKKDLDESQSQENTDVDADKKRLKRKLKRFSFPKINLESDSSSGRSTPARSEESGEEAAKDINKSRLDESSKDKRNSSKDQNQENSDVESNENSQKKKFKRSSSCKTNLEADSTSGRSTPARSDESEEAPKDNECGEKATKENASDSRQSKRSSKVICNTDYGRLVWAKTGTSRPWPAVIVNYEHCGESKPPNEKAWVLWFGDYRITQVPLIKVTDFVKNFKNTFVTSYNSSYNIAVVECLKECREQSGLEAFPDKKRYVKWGENGLTGFNYNVPGKGGCSPNVARCLSRIRKMRSREKFSSSEASFFPTATSDGDDPCAEARKTWKPKAALIKSVREGKQDVEKICIGCDRIDCEVVAPHSYFHGGTCSACKDELDDLSGFVPDGTTRYCVICGSPGELIICDGEECGKVFCSGCIELLVSPKALQDIMDTDPWLCFLCTPYSVETHGILKPRPDWEKIADKPRNPETQIPEVEDETPDISKFPQKPIRVLSLFDGIATGRFVLDKLGLDVEVYYAAEINEPAKNVASINFGSRVVNIGDVQAVTDKKIAEMCPIDLLIGGSPCNDLSFVNPNRKGLFDPTGTGILFFHYFRALKTILLHNKDRHLFWLFENVNHMPREFKFHINTFLGREPVVIDAKYFSPQSRPRCFWGNIPDMYKPLPEDYYKRVFPLDKYISKVPNRVAFGEKVNCITTNQNSLKAVFKMNDYPDLPWITEIEKIFGFPAHYTDVGNLNIRQRQALLGRSWSVGVVEYILKPLTKYFPVRQNRRKENEASSNSEN